MRTFILKYKIWIFLFFLVALNLFLRTYKLDIRPVWYGDEGSNLEIAWNLVHGKLLYLSYNHTFLPHLPLFFTLAGDEFVRFVRKKWFLAAMALAIFLIANQRLTRDVPFEYNVEKIAKEGTYPLGAVEYLKQNPIDGNMFNEYNWGGFLIWQYPEKKVFVDGRMPSWKFGGQKIFEQHNNIMLFQGDWQGDLKKYNVKFALLYNNPANKIMFLNTGWKEVYSDDISLVYTLPDQ